MKLRLLLTIVVLAATAMIARAEDVVGRPIAPWQPGMLDIHQISTGRGNAGLRRAIPGSGSVECRPPVACGVTSMQSLFYYSTGLEIARRFCPPGQ